MTKIQSLELEALLMLDKVCKEHNLRYYIAYGTCLGAIRHHGFIPWDHDIDVLMHIDDVKRLEQLQSEFGDRYEIYSYRTNSECKSISVKLLDKDYPCYEHVKGRRSVKTFISMDIYPFYNVPDNWLKFKFNILRSHIYKMVVGGIPQNHGTVSKLVSRLILLFYPEKSRQKNIERFEGQLNYKGKSHRIADYYGLDISAFNAIAYEQVWFSKPQEIAFEDYSFSAPTDIDKYLTMRYGDYMSPPSDATKESEIKIELIDEGN